VPTGRVLRASLLEASRRYSRFAHEAEDLAHDLILTVLERGRSLDDPQVLRSARGSARLHGAFLARTAARRRSREARAASSDESSPFIDTGDARDPTPLSALSPSLRTTLLLLALGLDKAELRMALGLQDAALRKRLQSLRERAPLAKPRFTLARRPPLALRLRRVQVALLRHLDAPGCANDGGARRIAFADPDGHGIILGEALTSRGAAATSPRAPVVPER